MRFHFGFSFNWKTIKKYLPYLLLGLFFYFSSHSIVLGYSINNEIDYNSLDFTSYIGYHRNGYSSTYSWDIKQSDTTFGEVSDGEIVSSSIVYPYRLGTGNYRNSLNGMKISISDLNFEKDKYYVFIFKFKLPPLANITLNSELISVLSDCKLDYETGTTCDFLNFSNSNISLISTFINHSYGSVDTDYSEHRYEFIIKATENFTGLEILFGDDGKQTSTIAQNPPNYIFYWGDIIDSSNYTDLSVEFLMPDIYKYDEDPTTSLPDTVPPSTDEILGNIEDTITDDSLPSLDFLDDIELSDDSAISDLLLMPISILQKVGNSIDDTCTPYSIDFGFFGSDYVLNLPCFNGEKYFGSFWTIFDYLICFFFIYEFGMLCITVFEDITTLRDTYGGLYQPKHARDSRVSRGEDSGLY